MYVPMMYSTTFPTTAARVKCGRVTRLLLAALRCGRVTLLALHTVWSAVELRF